MILVCYRNIFIKRGEIMAIREGRWDCTYCSTSGILGRQTTCPNCSRTRPEGTKFYLPENAPVVSNTTLLEQAKAGPDWICNFCASSNSASESSCNSCGHSREGDSHTQKVIDYDLGQEPRHGDNYSGSEEDSRPDSNQQDGEGEEVTSNAFENTKENLLAIFSNVKNFDWYENWYWPVGLISTLLFVMLLWGFFHTRTVDLTVTGVQWERTIPVEVYKTFEDQGWSVPPGGREQSSRQKIHHYDQVFDHYETKTRQVSERVKVGTRTYTCGSRDLGNGFFEDIECEEDIYETRYHTETYQEAVTRDEPRYQTWYTYEIERWVHARTEKSSGNNHEVYWPEYELAKNERVGYKTESYVVYFVDSEAETYSKAMSYNEWTTFKKNSQYQAEVNAFGQIKEIVGSK